MVLSLQDSRILFQSTMFNRDFLSVTNKLLCLRLLSVFQFRHGWFTSICTVCSFTIPGRTSIACDERTWNRPERQKELDVFNNGFPRIFNEYLEFLFIKQIYFCFESSLILNVIKTAQSILLILYDAGIPVLTSLF